MNRLVELRKEKLMLPKEVAKELDISLAVYLDYENYDLELTQEHLIKLALLYNTSTDYILGLTNIKKPYQRSKEYDDK